MDSFSFVTFEGIKKGVTIKFTNRGVRADGSFGPGEKDEDDDDRWTYMDVFWTADAFIGAGTVIVVTQRLALSHFGGCIIAYQGTWLNPTFLYAISFDATRWEDSESTSTTVLPPGTLLHSFK